MTGFREARKKRGYSQQYVASKLNISREALSYYENEKREPNFDTLKAMSDLLHVSIDFLVTGKEFRQR